MNRSHRITTITALTFATTLALLAATGGPARAIDNKDELYCQLHASLNIGKFISKKMKCIDGCWKRAFVDPPSASDCAPPYAGKTAGCVQSIEGKTGGAIQSDCNKDCPECYTGGDCMTDADTKIADAEAHVEAVTADVFCDDSASGDGLTLSEFKCQRTVNKSLAKFAAKKLKCYAKCRKGEFRGKIPAGDCDPPAADLKTQGCISKLEQKVAFLVDKKCESGVNPSADKPECGSYPINDGAAWAAGEEAEIDARHGNFFCND